MQKVKVGMGRLLAFNKPEWGYLFIGCIASAMLGVVMPLFAVLLAEIVSLFYPAPGEEDETKRKAMYYSLCFLGLAIGQLTVTTVQSFCFTTMGVRLAQRIRVILLRAILHQVCEVTVDIQPMSTHVQTFKQQHDSSFQPRPKPQS